MATEATQPLGTMPLLQPPDTETPPEREKTNCWTEETTPLFRNDFMIPLLSPVFFVLVQEILFFLLSAGSLLKEKDSLTGQ